MPDPTEKNDDARFADPTRWPAASRAQMADARDLVRYARTPDERAAAWKQLHNAQHEWDLCQEYCS